MAGDARRHLPDRAEPEHHDAAALGDVGERHGLPGGGQHVGEVEEALVGRAVGDHDGAVLRLRHPQVLGLPAGHLPVELREAEQRGAHALVAVLGGLALRLEVARAHPAVSAGDVERDDDAVADLEIPCLGPDLLDDAHRLVAEDVALVEERPEDLVEVQVGAADRGARDAHDRVVR